MHFVSFIHVTIMTYTARFEDIPERVSMTAKALKAFKVKNFKLPNPSRSSRPLTHYPKFLQGPAESNTVGCLGYPT